MDLNVVFFYNDKCGTDIEDYRNSKALSWLSIVQAKRGHFTVSVGDSGYFDVPAGSSFIAPADVWQDIHHFPADGWFEGRYVFIDARFADNRRFEDKYIIPPLLPPQYNARMDALLDEVEACGTTGLAAQCQRASCAYRILALLTECSERKFTPDDDEMDCLIQYIKDNIALPFNMQLLAKTANMSEQTLYKRFKKRTGCSPMFFVNWSRITVAASMIEMGYTHIAEIAEKCGYSNQFYFSRQFKKNLGYTPKGYIKLINDAKKAFDTQGK